MKILILGATGRTGRHVLSYALSKGFEVNCLVRDLSKMTSSDKLTIFKGTPENPGDLKKALVGCKFVINVLNISRKNDFPWSPLRTPSELLSQTTQSLIELSKSNPIQRIVSCSAWGVGDSNKEIPWWFKWTIDNSNIQKAYIDHEKQEQLLKASSLNYTIIRPTGLTNSKTREKVKESMKGLPKPNLIVGRKTLANFLVDALQRVDLERRTVTVSKA